MEIILLEKMGSRGNLGDKVNVKPGYARNYLYPKNKAVPATKANIAKFEVRRAELEKIAESALMAAKARAAKLADQSITLVGRASEEGRLYGSFGTKDIADALTQLGVVVEKREVLLPNGVLREVGEYEIGLHLHADVIAKIKVIVTAES